MTFFTINATLTRRKEKEGKMKEKEKKEERITFHTTEDLKCKLQGYAVDDMRTLADFVYLVLKKYVEKREKVEEKEE